jgi:hypothetical protein
LTERRSRFFLCGVNPAASPQAMKGQCTPKHALVISLVVALGGVPAAFAANFFLLTPLGTAFLYYLFVTWLTAATTWCFVLWRTRNIAVRLWNFGIGLFLCLMVVALITQKEGEPFPRWAVGLLLAQGCIWAVTMSCFAVANFLKWRNGQL